MTRCLLLPLLLAIACPIASAEEVDLDQPTTVTLAFEDEPLWTILAAFEEETGTQLEVKSTISGEKEILAKQISIELKDEPYWEAVVAIMDAANLNFGRITHRGVVLIPRSGVLLRNGTDKPAGKPVTAGKFSVRPWLNTVHRELQLVVRPEPSIASPHLVDYSAKLTFADGTTAHYHPQSLIWIYGLKGELDLRIERKAVGRHQVVSQIDLKAELNVPTRWDEVTLPPMGEILPGSVDVGGGTIRIEQFGLEEKPNSKKNAIVLRVYSKGVLFNNDAGVNRFTLMGKDGARIPAAKSRRTWGETDGIAWESIRLNYPAEQVKGDLATYRLAIQLEGNREEIIAPIAKIAPRPIEAGKALVDIVASDLKNGTLNLQVHNFLIPDDRVWLDVRDGRVLEPVRKVWGSRYPFSHSYMFPVDDVKTAPEPWRLVLEAPTEAKRHTLRATLRDVRIKK